MPTIVSLLNKLHLYDTVAFMYLKITVLRSSWWFRKMFMMFLLVKMYKNYAKYELRELFLAF